MKQIGIKWWRFCYANFFNVCVDTLVIVFEYHKHPGNTTNVSCPPLVLQNLFHLILSSRWFLRWWTYLNIKFKRFKKSRVFDDKINRFSSTISNMISFFGFKFCMDNRRIFCYEFFMNTSGALLQTKETNCVLFHLFTRAVLIISQFL